MTNNNVGTIARLLTEAQSAHHAFETATLKGVRDPEWATWYANFLFSKGFRLNDINGAGSITTLAYFMEYVKVPEGANWAGFVALELVAHFSPEVVNV